MNTATAATIALGSAFVAYDGTFVTVHDREALDADMVLLHVSEPGGPIDVYPFGKAAALTVA